MLILQGIAVSPGVAIGEALVVDHEGFRIPQRFVQRDAVAGEMDRLQTALSHVASRIEENRKTIDSQLGSQYGDIFAAHLRMLQDSHLLDELHQLIREDSYSAEYAVSTTLRKYAKAFEQLPGLVFPERAHDIRDIERRLLSELLGQRREDLRQLSSPVIVLAHNLTPSETSQLHPDFVLAFVTELGGVGGHTSILAKAKEIPAVVGVGRFLSDVAGGDQVIVDGDHGRVIVQPDQPTLKRYEEERRHHLDLVHSLEELRDLPAEMADGERIQLSANIEFPHEVQAALNRGADGVGLYRTEFLYLASDGDPTEEDHFQAYSEVVQAMQGKQVVIRTLDLGADKLGREPQEEAETNPFLGLRSIRLSLKHVDAFRTQLRAILRASALGQVQVMFPMIATIGELKHARRILEEAMSELKERNIEFDREIPVGMMVEVPSSVILIERFLENTDFISIGTNDLVQYTLAVDRSNRDVYDLYQATDPAVLALLEKAATHANRSKKHVSACGQMSSEPREALLLLGLGVRHLSMPPAAIPEVKAVCRKATMADCKRLAEKALQLDQASDINILLFHELERIAPELLPHGP